MRRHRLLIAVVMLSLPTACTKLPEPESAGAQLYARRCNDCHRLFQPGTLKYEMWKVQVERMQGEFVRRGLPPLSSAERAVLLDYLKRHSG